MITWKKIFYTLNEADNLIDKKSEVEINQCQKPSFFASDKYLELNPDVREARKIHMNIITDMGKQKGEKFYKNSRASRQSGFQLGLITGSNIQNGGLNKRAEMCGSGELIATTWATSSSHNAIHLNNWSKNSRLPLYNGQEHLIEW